LYGHTLTARLGWLLLIVLSAGCGVPDRGRRVITFRGRGLSEQRVAVNGELANAELPIRFLVLPGSNTISLRGKTSQSTAFRYVLYLEPLQGMSGTRTLLWLVEGKGNDIGSEVVAEDFQFTVARERQWEWPKADVIDELTEKDRKDIRTLYVEFCLSMQKRGTRSRDLMDSGSVVPWSREKDYLREAIEMYDQIFSALWGQEEGDLECLHSVPSQLVLEKGRKMVVLIDIEGGPAFSFKISRKVGREKRLSGFCGFEIFWLYVARFDGEWKVMFWYM